MYTYTFSKQLCQILEIEFEENIATSDQELGKLPEDCLTSPHKIYSNLGTIAAAEHNKGRKRPEHSELMRKYYAEGRINPPRKPAGVHKLSEESRRLIGQKSGASRLGKKRPTYKNKKIEVCSKCSQLISGARNIKTHNARCN